MRVFVTPSYQCLKCFTPFEMILNEEKSEVICTHNNYCECEDSEKTFKLSVSELTREV